MGGVVPGIFAGVRGNACRVLRRIIGVPALVVAACSPMGCLTMVNENFNVPAEQVREDWSRMSMHPTGVERPVVVLNGWRAPGLTGMMLVTRLKRLTGAGDDDFLGMSYPLSDDIDALARRVIARVEAKWSSDDPTWTREVDVVAVSMGGLVARWAAEGAGDADGKRLKIRRLFTLATPHKGAKLASVVAIDRASRRMRPGSEFLRTLDEALESAPYELVCYARLHDMMVGATNTAPDGHAPIWLGNTRLLPHIMITTDERITLDIARRLRGEPPLALRGSPPPTD